MTAALSYLSSLPFEADAFQFEAAEAIDRGETVVVTAPTGSGKTVIAEAAITRALGSEERAVYTTPLKALSNQKYSDLREVHGPDGVGLLTGDNSINGTAPIVVMTTEVLRNMMYADSPDLADVGVVVLDEVHYLQDPVRGPVWEEIIVHLNRAIPLICLSATVANPMELAEWVRERRGPTHLVVERERPVPLESTYLLRDRWEAGSLRLLPVFEGATGRPNGRLIRMLRPQKRRPGRMGPAGPGRRYTTPRRFETAEFLRDRGMLPAIYFIFSRRGCEQAAATVVDRGLRLTDRDETEAIRAEAARRTAHLSARDLHILAYDRWLSGLEAGVAPHHAGMVPAFKETVERLFARGLVKLVFATETLALGINMPARTVVLEHLSKFTGESHELLMPGDYTQLTGRAGRRGIDESGTAVVLHSPFVAVERVAAIAAAGSHPLSSSFRPTYNMAVNLVARYDRATAEELLNASFAQFRAGRSRRELSASLAADLERLENERRRAWCEHGDVTAALDAPSADRILIEFISTTSAGDVLEWVERGRLRRHVVVARGHGARPRLLCVSDDADLRRLAPERLPDQVARLGRMDLPAPFRPREGAYRRRVADQLAAWRPDGEPDGPPESDGAPPCPDWDQHIAAARKARRLERRIEGLHRRLDAEAPGLVPRLRAILRLLDGWGYTRGWALTGRGERLRVIYNEMDLLLTECIERGLFEDLDSSGMAALTSAFAYTPRGGSEGGRWPTPELAERAEAVAEVWERLTTDERALGIPQTRGPEPGFAALAYRWAAGTELEDLFADDEESVGDFVRTCRQLIDLLRQIRDAVPRLADAAHEAARRLDRGVVAAAGAL
jgi:ATP-dependent RNA helicase HelY